MSTRFGLRTAAAAGLLAAILTGATVLPASGTVDDRSDADYTRSIQLSWDGTEYADRTTENFLGTPVAIPGDTATRMLRVRNDGPTDATFRATITNVGLLDPDAPDVQHQPAHIAPGDEYAGAGEQGNFYDDLRIDWAYGLDDEGSSSVGDRASMTTLAADGSTVIVQIPLAQGELVWIDLTYELPRGATSGNRANVSDRLASLQLVLELGGSFPTADTPPPTEPSTPGDPSATAEPTPSAGPTPSAEATDAPAATQAQPSSMPQTGADLRWPALAVATLLALGALLLRSARRREDVRGHH